MQRAKVKVTFSFTCPKCGHVFESVPNISESCVNVIEVEVETSGWGNYSSHTIVVWCAKCCTEFEMEQAMFKQIFLATSLVTLKMFSAYAYFAGWIQ